MYRERIGFVDMLSEYLYRRTYGKDGKARWALWGGAAVFFECFSWYSYPD